MRCYTANVSFRGKTGIEQPLANSAQAPLILARIDLRMLIDAKVILIGLMLTAMMDS